MQALTREWGLDMLGGAGERKGIKVEERGLVLRPSTLHTLL